MTDDIKCPICGSETTLRTSKKDGGKFHVCINFPECKGKVAYDGERDKDWLEEKPSRRKPLRTIVLIFYGIVLGGFAIFLIVVACLPGGGVHDVVFWLKALFALCIGIIPITLFGWLVVSIIKRSRSR